MSMSYKLRIWLTESPFGDTVLLGRTAADYLRREFAPFGFEVVREGSACVPDEGETGVVIPLDMPLVTADDVMRAAECLRHRRLDVLALGDGSSGARVFVRDGAEGGYFLRSPHFCKVDSAKNRALVYNQMKERIIDRLLTAEVEIPDVANTVVEDTVLISSGAKVMPFCRLTGNTVVRAGAMIEASYLCDTVVEEGSTVVMSHLADSVVGKGSTVGPFARLRGAHVGDGCRVGDFVEIKNAVMGDGAKSAHLAYVGDAEVGARTNVGCGTVFCNYDGKHKHRIRVGNDCFIGANANLVAPLTIGDGAYVAAGTTVTRDMAEGEFAIGRVRQETRPEKPLSSRGAAKDDDKK